MCGHLLSYFCRLWNFEERCGLNNIGGPWSDMRDPVTQNWQVG